MLKNASALNGTLEWIQQTRLRNTEFLVVVDFLFATQFCMQPSYALNLAAYFLGACAHSNAC